MISQCIRQSNTIGISITSVLMFASLLTLSSHETALAFAPSPRFVADPAGEPPPWFPPCGGSKLRLSLHGGSAIPAGSFANAYKAGVNGIADLTYFIRGDMSLTGMVGYNRFAPKAPAIDETYNINISVNVRYYVFRPAAIALYMGAGPGLYIPKTGSADLGANLGFGVDWCMLTGVIPEAGMDYHMIFSPDIQFLHVHVGIIIPL